MRLISLLLLYALACFASAQTITKETAEIVARNFYLEKQKRYLPNTQNSVQFVNNQKSLKSSYSNYHVLNLENEKGFVIVASSKKIKPVLAYSLSGNFELENMPPEVKAWMDQVNNQIDNSLKLKSSTNEKVRKEWEKYSNPDFETNLNQANKSLKSGELTSKPPLLSTTWNQGKYYNALCPTCPTGGNDGHVWTGCVATAQAQVMKYFNYPAQGVGQHSYSHNIYGLQSANFGNTTYDWSSMPSSLSAPNSAVANLMYHCGVSVNMNYSPSGSGASGSSVRNSLIDYYKYSTNALYTSKYAYTEENWVKLLKSELDNNRPLFYVGYGSDGHAFVCDGYQDVDYFHFNWGWGGAYDGYYYLNDLTPGGSSFNNSQAIIMGILPVTMEEKFDSSNVTSLSCNTVYNGTTADGDNRSNNYKSSNFHSTGKEKLHKITTFYPGRISAILTNLSGKDLDVFILKYANRNTCLTNGDSIATLDNAPAGTYYIVVDGKYANEGSYSLKVNCPDNKADLIVEKAKVDPLFVVQGGTIKVTTTINNIGNISAGASEVYYYYSADKSLSVDDIYLGNSILSGLSAKSKVDVTKNLNIPVSASEGTRYIIAKADGGNTINETDEDLNTLFASFQVPKAGSMDCSNAITLNNNILYEGNTQTSGTSTISDYSCISNLSSKEKIHKFTPSYSGIAEFEFLNILEGNMYMILLTGCNENACVRTYSSNEDQGGGELHGSNTFYVSGGVTYFLAVDGSPESGESEGPYSIKVKFPEECPKPVISPSSVNKCSNDSLVFLNTSWEYSNFMWRKNGTIIPGATNSSIMTTEAGSYTVEVTENFCKGVSTPTVVSFSPKPTPFSISNLTDTTFCEGESSSLKLTAGASYTYQWTCNNIPIIGATGNTIEASTSGIYRAEVTNGSCTVKSNSIEIIAYHSAFDQGNALQMKMTDLISYWPFNNWGSDESGNNNYIYTDGPTQTKDRKNNNSAFKLDGVNDYLYTSKQFAHPDIFTISLWFKATSGGKILSFDEQKTNRSSANSDRHIYMDSNGLLYFGVEDVTKYTIHTTQAYNDDNWHLATATLSPNGIKLYVDGQLKSQQSSPVKGKNYSGYWKIGYGDLSGWSGNPGNTYFKGSVDDVIIYSKELTADEIQVLYQEQLVNIYCSNDVICGASGTSSIIIENSEPGISYQLYNNSTNSPIGSSILGNSGTISLPTGTLNQTTQIKIKALNNSTQCEKQLDSIFKITVGSSVTPKVSISSNATAGAICQGDSVVFNSSVLYDGPSPSFVWKINEIPSGNTNSQFISTSLKNGDVVKLQLTTSIACASPQTVTSNAINVSLLDAPDKNITVTGNSIFCKGESASLQGIPSNIMEWYKVGSGKISTTNPLIISNSGKYYLYLENSNQCSSISDTLEFTMKNLPNVNLGLDISIYANELHVLDAGQASSYNWNTGETAQTITVNGNIGAGNYTYSVEVTGEYGCKNSDTIKVEVLSTLGLEDNIKNLKTIIFPNPSSEYLYIEFDEAIKGLILAELFTGRGQKVLRKECEIKNNGQKEKLDLQGLSKGIYYLKLTMGEQIAFYKIIIN
jgi:hypothetical protein